MVRPLLWCDTGTLASGLRPALESNTTPAEGAFFTMNPKAAQVWNFALAKMEGARQYIEKEQDELAKTEIAKAVYVGSGALLYLLGEGEAEQAAHQAAQRFVSEMAAEDCSAAEAYMTARKVLGFIAEMSPEEDRLPAP